MKTGQSCIGSNRLLVQRSVCQKFLEAFVAAVKGLKAGEASEPGVEIGPMIDQPALDHAEALVQDAVRRGAKALCGGKKIERKGFFFEATVLADVPADAACMREESFAPIAPVTAFDTEEGWTSTHRPPWLGLRDLKARCAPRESNITRWLRCSRIT